MAISVDKPTVGGSQDSWGTDLNAIIDTLVDTLNGTSGTVAPDLSTLTINGTDVTATSAELNTLDGVDTSGTGFGFVPAGGIIMWSGAIANIPAGWTLCDGIDHGATLVPDLRDRFIVGAGSDYVVGATGGYNTVALSEANMPAHSHPFSGTGSTTSTGNHNHTYLKAGPVGGGGYGDRYGSYLTSTYTGGSGAHNHNVSVSGTTSPKGSGTAHENRPPYYALAYIMKL
jgi:microcystin-dependent protein